MTYQRKSLGKFGETQALEFLKRKNYQIIGQNIRFKCGEIDILVQDQDNTLIIVEVKTKTDLEFGLPQEMVNLKKQKKLRQLAKVLAQKYPQHNLRIDVIAIDESSNSIEHILNAVEDV